MKIFHKMMVLGIAAIAMFSSAFADTSQEQTYALNIQAQSLDDALVEFAKQSGLQLATKPDICAGFASQPLQGRYTLHDALSHLLADSPCRYELLNPHLVAIRLKSESASLKAIQGVEQANSSNGVVRLVEAGPPKDAATLNDQVRSESNGKELSPESSGSKEGRGESEILVPGSRILNVDIPRSRDDAQPYVVFDREEIARSGAADLNDFFKKRLTMNTQGRSNAQAATFGIELTYGNNSEINLRGLGSNQTLILIDGRRVTSGISLGSPRQGNINGIPFAAIERIEVLPTTASGIYGGSATGGAINIVLRRDYAGSEVQATYDIAEEGSPGKYRMDFSTGHGFEEGRTSAMVTGSYQHQDELVAGDRDYIQRGRARILSNNPSVLFPEAGDPTLGATPNIRSADNSPLFGAGTPSFTTVPAGYAGGGGITPLQTLAGQYNFDSPDTAQPNGKRRALLPQETSKFITATIRREFSPRIDAFIEGRGSEQFTSRPSSLALNQTVSAAAPTNPFGQAVAVAIPLPQLDGAYDNRTNNYQAVGGVIARLPQNWTAATDYSWGQYVTRITTPNRQIVDRFSAGIASGAIDLLRDTTQFQQDLAQYISPAEFYSPQRVTSTAAALRLSGPAFSLPAGSIKISGLLEHRKDFFDDATYHALTFYDASYESYLVPNREQSIDSIYTELTIPIIGEPFQIRGARLLDLQLAGRYDRYEVIGVTSAIVLGSSTPIARVTNRLSSLDPTIAVRYKPVNDLMLRVSYGTGFRPPEVQQLISDTYSGLTLPGLVDPRRNNEAVGAITITGGGNPGLKPEQSESWSMGVIFTPAWLKGLRVAVDYTHIDKTDNIGTAFDLQQELLDNESLVPERVIRDAPSGGFSVGPVIGLNQTLFNIASAEVEAFDATMDWEIDTSKFGTWRVHSLATWQTHYKTQVTPVAPVVENVGVTVFNPTKFKANAGVTWQREGWTADWSARYFDDYLVSTSASTILSQGNGGRVPRQVYHDLFTSYRFSDRSSSAWLSGTELQLGIQNFFNAISPVDVSHSAAYYSTLGDPRQRTYSMSIKKGF